MQLPENLGETNTRNTRNPPLARGNVPPNTRRIPAEYPHEYPHEYPLPQTSTTGSSFCLAAVAFLYNHLVDTSPNTRRTP